MVLQASGQIAISDLRNEFGDTPGQDELREYYRGAGYVSDNNNNVPTSGQIALSNFHSAANGYYVTCGSYVSGGFNIRGYDASGTFVNMGSINPNRWRSQSGGQFIGWFRVSQFTFKGSTTRTFSIGIQGSLGRYHFSRYYDGSFNLYSSNAGMTSTSGYTVWSWPVGSFGYYANSAVRGYLYN